MGVLRSYRVTTATSASSRACQRVRTIVGEAPLSQPIISRSLPYKSSAVKWVEKERERCNQLKVEVALREEETARRQADFASQMEKLASDLKTCSTELEQCKGELEEARRINTRDEMTQEMDTLRQKVQQAEVDLTGARDKAAQDLATARAACMEDMSKARLEAASRLNAEAEKYRSLLQEKEAELVASK